MYKSVYMCAFHDFELLRYAQFYSFVTAEHQKEEFVPKPVSLLTVSLHHWKWSVMYKIEQQL